MPAASLREEELFDLALGCRDHGRSLGRHDVDRIMDARAAGTSLGEGIGQLLRLHALNGDRQSGRTDFNAFRNRDRRAGCRVDDRNVTGGLDLTRVRGGQNTRIEGEDPEGAGQRRGDHRGRGDCERLSHRSS